MTNPVPNDAAAADPITERGWKRRFKLVAFSLVPVLVLLLVGHCTASVATYRHLSFVTDSLTGVTNYHMRVGGWPWVHQTTTRLNTMGFPDIEYTNLPPKGDCVHVLFTGDSFTFGDALDGDLAWVSLVRQRIATAFPGRCIRVFNVAAPMSTIQQQLKRVREVKPILDPDYVILGQYQNDITDLTNVGAVAYQPSTDSTVTTFWGDRLRMITPGFDSPLPRMLTYRAFEVLGENRIKLDILSRWSVLADTSFAEYAGWLTGIYRSMFDSLATELNADGTGFGVVIMPSKMDIIAQRYPEGEFFEKLADQYALPRLSMMPVLDKRRKPFPYQTYDGHFNELGNRIVAESVFDWLFVSDSAPFPALREGLEEPRPPVTIRWWPQ